MLDVVVLAGGTEKGEFAVQTGIAHRPLLEVGGKPILYHVLTALNGSPRVDRVALVAPEPVLKAADELMVDCRVTAGEEFVENMTPGVNSLCCEHTGADDRVLIVTGDLPLINAPAITDFVDRAVNSHAEVAYPIIPRESSERTFPGGRRTYVRLSDGVFTGGNAVVVTRGFVDRQSSVARPALRLPQEPLQTRPPLGPRLHPRPRSSAAFPSPASNGARRARSWRPGSPPSSANSPNSALMLINSTT